MSDVLPTPREELEALLFRTNLNNYMANSHVRIVRSMTDKEIDTMLDRLKLFIKRSQDQLGSLAEDLLQMSDDQVPYVSY